MNFFFGIRAISGVSVFGDSSDFCLPFSRGSLEVSMVATATIRPSYMGFFVRFRFC